jgi:hypothetical protein
MNFFEGVRTGKPVVEDASFGLVPVRPWPAMKVISRAR